jgi:hypothetical protein
MRFSRFHQQRTLPGCWEGTNLNDETIHRPHRVVIADQSGEALRFRMPDQHEAPPPHSLSRGDK